MKKLTDDEVFVIYRKVIGVLIAIGGIALITYSFCAGYEDLLSQPASPKKVYDILGAIFLGAPIFLFLPLVISICLVAYGCYLFSKEKLDK